MNYLVKSTDFGQLERVESPQSFERMIRLNIKMIWIPEEVLASLESRSCIVVSLT